MNSKSIISIFFLSVVLFKSCVVYQKTPVSIQKASNQGKAKISINHIVDVAYNNGVVKTVKSRTDLFYKNIILEEGFYYGIYENRKIKIDTTAVLAIYLKDIEKSKKTTWQLFTIGIPVVFIVFGVYYLMFPSFGG